MSAGPPLTGLGTVPTDGHAFSAELSANPGGIGEEVEEVEEVEEAVDVGAMGLLLGSQKARARALARRLFIIFNTISK